MQGLISLLLLLALVGLILGLIKPSWVRMGTRVKSSFVFTGVFIALVVMLGATAPDEPNPYPMPAKVADSNSVTARSVLHNKTGLEWSKASDKEKTTVCLDFIAKLHNRIDKPLALELKECLDETFSGDMKNVQISETAVMCLALMGKLPSE